MAQSVFKRYELKYLVNREKAERIREVLSEHMEFDKYCEDKGSYTICNVYFDNQSDEIIRNSISKPYYKEKLRLRSYGLPLSGKDEVYLELKKKIGGVVSKRRVTMSYAAAVSFMEYGRLPFDGSYVDRQVAYEIADFQRHYSSYPKVFISYERAAYRSAEDNGLRVTFDSGILTRRDRVSLDEGDFGTELLGDDKFLMEVKVPGALPLWFVRTLSDMEVYSEGFSKYGTEYKNHMRSQNNDKNRLSLSEHRETGGISTMLTA
jgi:hypothetical protein